MRCDCGSWSLLFWLSSENEDIFIKLVPVSTAIKRPNYFKMGRKSGRPLSKKAHSKKASYKAKRIASKTK